MAGKKKKNSRTAHRGEEEEEEVVEEEKKAEEEGAPAAGEEDDEGGDADVDPRYPLQVTYCPVCGMPPEFCEFGPTPSKCFTEHPELHEGVEAPEPSAKEAKKAAAEAAEAKSSSEATSGEGGEGAAAAAAPAPAPAKGKKKDKKEVTMTVAQRNKRKFITTIAGLDLFDVKLAEISKLFSKRFACGSTVTKNPSMKDVVEVQGDVCTEVAEILVSKYNIPQDAIFVVHGKEKSLALP